LDDRIPANKIKALTEIDNEAQSRGDGKGGKTGGPLTVPKKMVERSSKKQETLCQNHTHTDTKKTQKHSGLVQQARRETASQKRKGLSYAQ